MQTAKLTRLRTNEVVYVNQPVFKIGKDPAQNDYAVSGNSAISRAHAEIRANETGFSIVDMNSSNHVYVNTDLIPVGVEITLTSGTTIRLADEDFLFEVG
jgi:pSer/pThr/pTyr-binding forkhead associated (FHA) protein